MAYLSNSPFIAVDGQIWEVNVGDKCQYQICPKYMKQMIRELNAMCRRYRRVFCVLFNLHMNSYTENNSIISLFEKKLFPLVKARYGVKDIGFVWVREMEQAKQQHYHFALFIDGKQIRHPQNLLDLVMDKWMLAGGSHVYTPKNCYVMIEKNAFQEKQKLIHRLSYYAKERGKGYKSKQAKNYSTSRIASSAGLNGIQQLSRTR